MHALQAEALRVHGGLAQINRDAAVRGRADTVGSLAAPDEHIERLGERSALAQADGLRLTVDFADHTLKFRVQHAAVARKRAGRRLRRQSARAIEKLRNVAETAVGRLQLAQTVVGVLNTLREHRFIGTVAVRDGQPGGVVAGIDDAQS